MDSIFELKAIVDGVECRIKNFFSLTENVEYFTPLFSLAGSTFKVCIIKGSFKRTTGGSINLWLERLEFDSFSMEYTFSIKMRNGNEYGEERRTHEFYCGISSPSPSTAITLDGQRLSQLMPDDTLTVVCRLRRIDLTLCAVPNVTQFKKKFEENTAELDSVKKKLEEKTAELVSVKKKLEENTAELVSVKKKLEEKTAELVSVKKELENEHSEYASQFKKEMEEKAAELNSIKKELGTMQSELMNLKPVCEELNLKMVDIEAKRENLQRLLTNETENSSQLKKELEQKDAVQDSVKKELGNKFSELSDLKHIHEKIPIISKLKSTLAELMPSITENSSEVKSAELDFVKKELENKQIELNKLKCLYDELTFKMIDIEADRENLQSLSTSGTQSLLCDVTDNVNFAHDFNHFLEEKTDVTFVLETLDGKKEFFAHQCVLAMKSSYFADEFCEKQRNEDKLVIHLKNINPKAFKDMIRYCYNFEPCLRTTEETCALLEVAFQFKVVSLVDVCQAFLKEARIEPGNVFSLLFVSQKTGDKGLVEKCNKFLQDQTKEVIESYELCNVTPLMVHTILDLPKLSLCFEYELIKWIFDWAKVKCQEKDSVCNSAREYLEKLLQDMNFLALTFEEFVALCKNNPEFFSSGEFQSISMNIASPGTMEMPDWYDKDLKIRTYTGVKE